MSQNTTLSNLEGHLDKTAKGTAKIMGVSYDTYKAWKGERRNMTGATRKLVEVLIAIKGSSVGKEFGI